MTNRRLLIGGGVFTLVLLLLVGSCSILAPPTTADPDPVAECREVFWSPTNAPAGSNWFGDGRPLVGSSADELELHFVASGTCDPFQLSVREMIWDPQKYPDEAARFARQQQLANDLGELTNSTERMIEIVRESEWTTETWSGEYETLFAAHTSDGWHAYKLRKGMEGKQLLVQKTKGGRTLAWKVECLFQPVAKVLKGFPSGPPSNPTSPPPPTGGYNTPPPGSPPGTTPTNAPPTTWKCDGVPSWQPCGTPNSGSEQQPVQENEPEHVAPTPGYTAGEAEQTITEQENPNGEHNPSPGGYNCGSASCAPGEGTQNPSGPGVTEPIGGGGGEEPPDR